MEMVGVMEGVVGMAMKRPGEGPGEDPGDSWMVKM